MAKKKAKFRIPFDEIAELLGALLANGHDPSELPGVVGQFFDDAIAFDKLVPGPVGAALEAIDGPTFKAAAKLILMLVKPEKLIARAQAA